MFSALLLSQPLLTIQRSLHSSPNPPPPHPHIHTSTNNGEIFVGQIFVGTTPTDAGEIVYTVETVADCAYGWRHEQAVAVQDRGADREGVVWGGVQGGPQGVGRGVHAQVDSAGRSERGRVRRVADRGRGALCAGQRVCGQVLLVVAGGLGAGHCHGILSRGKPVPAPQGRPEPEEVPLRAPRVVAVYPARPRAPPHPRTGDPPPRHQVGKRVSRLFLLRPHRRSRRRQGPRVARPARPDLCRDPVLPLPRALRGPPVLGKVRRLVSRLSPLRTLHPPPALSRKVTRRSHDEDHARRLSSHLPKVLATPPRARRKTPRPLTGRTTHRPRHPPRPRRRRSGKKARHPHCSRHQCNTRQVQSQDKGSAQTRRHPRTLPLSLHRLGIIIIIILLLLPLLLPLVLLVG